MGTAIGESGRTVSRMTDYIDRQKLLKDIEQYHLSDGKFQHWVEVQPSIDVQPVVRCKDCRHRYLDKKYGFRCDLDTGDPFEESRSAENDDWFCADGIKMNGEQND